MAKGNGNLEVLKSETTKQVGIFLRSYYNQDTLTPYLKQATLNFIGSCRYRKDDIRPVLVRLGYELNGGGNFKHILPAMTSIHLILLGFMPFDDIIDGATKQNFRNPEEFSGKLALAYSLSTKLKESGRSLLRKYYRKLPNYFRIDELISECSERLDGSHTLEVNFDSKKSLSEYSINDYINLIDEATSVLIAASFVIGGLINGIDEQTEKAMWNYGMELGRLCQIRDDFLDYIDPKITGKLAFADLSEKRKRFPLLIAYREGNESGKQKIEKVLGKESLLQKDICNIMKMITSKEMKGKTREVVNRIYNRAVESLERLPKKQPAYNFLREITNLFAMR